jgi:hypothetical protein
MYANGGPPTYSKAASPEPSPIYTLAAPKPSPRPNPRLCIHTPMFANWALFVIIVCTSAQSDAGSRLRGHGRPPIQSRPAPPPPTPLHYPHPSKGAVAYYYLVDLPPPTRCRNEGSPSAPLLVMNGFIG